MEMKIVFLIIVIFVLIVVTVFLFFLHKKSLKKVDLAESALHEAKSELEVTKKRQKENESLLAKKSKLLNEKTVSVKAYREQVKALEVSALKKMDELNKLKEDAKVLIRKKMDQAVEENNLLILEAQQKSKDIKQQTYENGESEAASILKEAETNSAKNMNKAKTAADKIIQIAKEKENEIIQNTDKQAKLLQAIKSELGILEEQYDYSIPTTVSVSYEMESEHVKAMLKQKRDEQKLIRKEKSAYNGQAGELMMRAFDCEANAHLNKVTPRNLSKTRQKVTSAFETINRLGEDFDSEISDEALHLKIDELSIYHSYSVIKEKEREEQRAIREQMREEERARKEYEKALRDAEKEERAIKKALEKARREMAKASAEKHADYEAKLSELQAKLTEAESMHQRAESMAQITKRGHVYIISNIGSFGENMFKIGMTRRLEPMDRVKELGDASVPFPFDVHGMIFSDDAPALEAELHRTFSDKRTNKINLRKEFFNVGIKEIQQEVEKLGLEVDLTLVAEAYEYIETVNMSEKEKEQRKILESVSA